MGVHGLWKLLEPAGKPVPLESLENKVLGVDVSIWLHQLVKGFQDTTGNPLPNAHLLGLFHRICKLLFYKIKPVFVFDGGVPLLKKQTVAARKQQKSKAELDAEKLRERLLKNLIKHKALKKILGDKASEIEMSLTKPQQESDMFKLPPIIENVEKEECGSEVDDELTSSESESPSRSYATPDLHMVDVTSPKFKALPADIRHDILCELKETRKQSSWGHIHQMPKESNNFSEYQMKRLLKRHSVQVSLEEAKQEMGGKTLSLGELESLLSDQGVVMDVGKRIASDDVTRFVYVTEDKQKNEQTPSTTQSETGDVPSTSTTKDDASSTSKVNLKSEPNSDVEDIGSLIPQLDEVEFESDWSSDGQDSNFEDLNNVQVARNYMFENSGLTQEQILSIIKLQTQSPTKRKQNSEIEMLHSDNEETNIVPISTIRLHNVEAMSMSVVENLILISDSKSDPNDVECLKPLNTNDHSNVDDITNKPKHVDVTLVQGIMGEETINEAVPSNIEDMSNIVVETIQQSFVTNNLDVIEENNRLQESTVESDSDAEFVEVDDLQSNNILNPNEYQKEKLLEVYIKCNKTSDVEEDIFADIFSPNISTKVEATSSSKLSSDLHTDNSEVKVLVNNTPKHIEPTDVNEEVINEELKTTVSKEATQVNQEVPQRGGTIEKKDDLPTLCSEEKTVGTIPEQELNPATSPVKKLTDEQLQSLQTSLEEEHGQLIFEKNRQERMATSITDQMYIEAQELLQLFGIPYIIAPMEAEAQCAFLDAMSLTDGTITDDSDIWLFGGQKVYKNFFNQKKHVLQFQAVDIQHYFKLARQQLVLLALLVGSDYTTGLQGVGPVTALEILSTFSSSREGESEVLQSLYKFRDWLKGGRVVTSGKATLRNKLKDVRLQEGFPNTAVVEAYLHPEVDESREKFSWGTPDVMSLREFGRIKFGWTQSKADEILLPVIKKCNEKQTQKFISSYFQVIHKLQAADGKLSKRVKRAIAHMDADSGSDVDVPAVKKLRGQRNKKGKGCGKTEINDEQKIDVEGKNRNVINSTQKSNITKRGRARGRGQSISVAHPKPSTSTEFIPQKEKDKLHLLKNKLRAIEVFHKSKKGLKKTKRNKLVKRQELADANLSESSSD